MSSNTSTGQWIGYIVGAIVGYFVGPQGGMAVGAAIGGAIGGAIDPPKGPRLTGPRLSDLSTQTSSYGAAIPRIHGTVAMYGNMFWIEGNALKENEEKSGGGKDEPEMTTFRYTATFAIGLCQGPVHGIRRIWAGSKLIYDGGSTNTGTIISSKGYSAGFRFYNGSETQMPDPRMEAALGVGNVPAYRGLAYIVFEDFDLTDYGNSLVGCQFKVEVVETGTTTGWARTTEVANTGFPYMQSFDVNNGIPYIARVENDVVYVGTAGSNWIHLYSLDGAYIDKEWENTIPSFDRAGNIFCVGVMDDYGFPVTVYCDISKPVGEGGGLTQNLNRYLPDDHYVMSAQISNNGEEIIVFTARPGESMLSLYPRDWFHFGYNIGLIASGTTDFNVDINTFGFGRAATYLYGTGAFDSEAGVVVSAFGAGTGEIWACTFNGSTLSKTEMIGVLSNHAFTRPSVYFINGTLVAVSGPSFDVFTNGRIEPTYPDLGDVIERECLLSGLLSSSDIDTAGVSELVRGYRISSVGSIRSALEPLQTAWPFDALQSGYKIKFVRRGNTPVASIAQTDLDARGYGDKPAGMLTMAREMDSQLPNRVMIRYIDPSREYDQSEQDAERLNTESVNIQEVELPIVMLADEAAGVAETLIYLRWLERYDFSFKLPPTFRHLEPADVVSVSHDGKSYEFRLISLQYLSEGGIEVRARLNNPYLYTWTAAGAEGSVTGVDMTSRGPTRTVVLDLPVLADSMNTAGQVIAMGGYLPGWPGGSLHRSTDDGATWSAILSKSSPGAVIGRATTVLASPITTTMIDGARTVVVKLVSGELESVSHLALLNGANHFAIGAPGRWEVLAAQFCTLNGDGTYTLSNLLRGRFGTEWAASLHQLDDTVVLLDQAKLSWMAESTSNIGRAAKYRGITFGQRLAEARDIEQTYAGIGLKPLSPVYANGSKHPISNDWTVTWVRRTRVGGEWRDSVDASLGETNERYDVEVYADRNYSAIKRTFSGLTSAQLTYTSAQQTTDFGAAQTTLYLKIYQISEVVGRGYPLTEYIPHKELLGNVLGLHFDGANGSTEFTEINGKTAVVTGNAQISTAQSKFGGASGYFDGTGDYIGFASSTEFVIGTNDFTIRFWIRTTNSNAVIIDFWSASAGWEVYLDSTGRMSFYMNSGYIAVAPTVVNNGEWHHVEIGRASGMLYFFIDGNIDVSPIAFASGLIYQPAYLYIGAQANTRNATYDFSGYIDDLLITNGLCEHTENFTPPTTPFPL